MPDFQNPNLREGSRLQREMLATALVSLSGRMEAASGLPTDEVPDEARLLWAETT